MVESPYPPPIDVNVTNEVDPHPQDRGCIKSGVPLSSRGPVLRILPYFCTGGFYRQAVGQGVVDKSADGVTVDIHGGRGFTFHQAGNQVVA